MEQWALKSRPIIKNILIKSIPSDVTPEERNKDTKMIDIILDDINIQYWAIAFTHKSVDPNSSSNYEPFEILGDKMLGLVFTQIVQQAYRQKGKEADPGRITELLSDIMNSKYQEKLAEKWGLMNILLVNAPHMKKTGSDVFEAFFGMLSYLGDVIGRGIGYIWSYNVLAMMIADVDPVNYVIDQPKVFINDVFTGYKHPNIKPYVNTVEGGFEASFTIPVDLATQLKLGSHGSWRQSPQFGKTKVKAIDNAYRNLSNELKKRKITTRGDLGMSDIWNNPSVIDTYRRALSKGNFVDFRVNSFKVVNGTYVQLIGVDDTDYMYVVYAKDYTTPNVDATRAKELLQEYLSS